jgi:DNA-binding SARP family transcriptional activator
MASEESCPACGVSVALPHRFCHECGARLGSAEGGAERRLLTAVRCELVGEGARFDDEESLLAFAGLASQEVGRYGGVIVDRTGASLTALMGVPAAREDHAQRAVLWAMSLRGALAGPWSARPQPVDAAFGVATGEAIVNIEGSRVVSVVGDPIEEAYDLSRRAEPGAILLGATTEEAVRGYVTCEALAPGEAGSAPAFVVTGRGRRVSRLDRAHRHITRFVGRDRQMMALAELLEETQAGRGQVIGIAADAGMGKSRLVAEFLAGPAADVRVREGRCLSYATATPFVPIADIVRAQVGLAADASEQAVVPALVRRLERLGLDGATHTLFLASLLGSASGDAVLRERSPEAVRETTLESLVALLVAEAAEASTIVLIEDLHWMDPVSQDVVGRFVEALPGRRAMILCTFRPGFSAPWMGVSYATQLALPPLSAAASREVVESVVGDLVIPDDIVDAVIARADGNPFFLEELSHAAAGGALGVGGVPATVHDVLLARIDQLDPVPRRLLRTASVLGREFPRELLAAIWDDEGDLDALLEELRRREFLFEEGDERRVLHFRHALTHDVAYSGLLASRRRDLHRVAGEALETLQVARPDDSYGLLGYHFSRAGEHVRAVDYLVLAAERALQAYSNQSAAEALELALGHIDQSGTDELRRRAPAIVFRLAFTLYLLGRFRDALDRLESPLARPDPSEARQVAEHDFWLSYFHTHLGDSEAAHLHARRAIDAATVLGDRFTAGRAHYVLTREDFWLCRYAEGVENGRRAVELLEGSDDWWWWLGHASSWKGLCHLDRGEFEDALRDCRRMNAIGVERDDPRLQSYSDWNLGWIEATRGNAAAGVLHCTRSLQRSPDPLNSAYSTGWLGFCHREAGDYVQAIAHLERSIDALRGFGYSRLVGWFGTWLADAYLAAGRRDDARRASIEALEVSEATAYPWAIAIGTRAAGRLAEAEGRLDDARALLEDALDRFADIDARFDHAATRLDLARIQGRLGDPAAALVHADAALTTFDVLATPTYEGRARRLLAELRGDSVAAPGAGVAAEGGRPALRVESLGRFSIVGENGTPLAGEGLVRELMAALLATREVPVHRDRLVQWMWPGDSPDAGRAALDTAIGSLRDAVGSRLVEEGATLRFALRNDDAWDVRDLLRASDGTDGDRSADDLAFVLSRHGAPLFAEWPDAEWARPLRIACRQAVDRLRGRLAASLLGDGRHDEARVHFAQLADAAPEDEAWHRGLMRCHAAAGDTALALRQYHACRSALRQALSADPSPETQELYFALMRARQGPASA